MNILFIKKLFSPVGGSEALTYQLATRLAARGHRVRVLSLWPVNHRYGFPAPNEAVASGQDYRLYNHRGLEVYQLRPRLGSLGQVLDVLAPFNLLRHNLADSLAGGFDVVHNVCREYAEDALAIARRQGAAFVTTPLAHPRQVWGGGGRHDREIYRRANAVVALTDAERRWYVRHGVAEERTVSIGLGPTFDRPGDGEAFRRRYGLRGQVVLFVGRKERYKGIHDLVAAAPLVWSHHPETSFVFVGQHSALAAVAHPFRGASDPRLVDLPSVPESEKPDVFAACDVFCLPSRHETFGLVLAEAWLCGKPVVGSDIPALREVIADGKDGLVVAPRPRAIAAALTRLLDSPELARQMGEAGRQKVARKYNWDVTVDEHEALYARVREETSRRS